MRKYITKIFHYKNDLDKIDEFLNKDINIHPNIYYHGNIIGYVSCGEYIIITVEFWAEESIVKDLTYFKDDIKVDEVKPIEIV